MRRGGILTLALVFAVGCGGEENGGTGGAKKSGSGSEVGGTTGEKTDGSGGTDGAGATGTPSANPWTGFEVGDYAQYKTVTVTSGTKMEATKTLTITEIDDERVKYNEKNVREIMGNTHESTTPMEELLSMDPEESAETGEETITVPAGEFECTWRKVKGPGDEVETTWYSPRVPGGMVKRVLSGTMKMTTELTKFKGK